LLLNVKFSVVQPCSYLKVYKQYVDKKMTLCA